MKNLLNTNTTNTKTNTNKTNRKERKTMKKNNIKTRIIATALSAITIFSVGSMAITSASAVEVSDDFKSATKTAGIETADAAFETVADLIPGGKILLAPFKSVFHTAVDDENPQAGIENKLDKVDGKLDQLDSKLNDLNKSAKAGKEVTFGQSEGYEFKNYNDKDLDLEKKG